jgi:hypothetical protein
LDNLVENPDAVVIMLPGITPDAKYSWGDLAETEK